MPSDDDSLTEASSGASDNEETQDNGISLSCSEELSGEEEEYRYAKRIRQQAEAAWRRSLPPWGSEEEQPNGWDSTEESYEDSTEGYTNPKLERLGREAYPSLFSEV